MNLQNHADVLRTFCQELRLWGLGFNLNVHPRSQAHNLGTTDNSRAPR